MSWEAVAWANRQRLKLPLEQFVLLVLANCADPDGVAFAKWPGKNHWWTYIADRTRMSKGSVFRHLNTIEELGLCTRSQMILADGTKRPIVQLDMQKVVDSLAQEHDDDAPDQSNHETGEATPQSSRETTEETAQSSSETEASLTVRPDQSHGETALSIGSKKDSKEPPNPPPGGGPAVDEDLEKDLEEAKATYPGGTITNMPRFRAAFGSHPRGRRKLILTAMRGYAALIDKCARQGKPRGIKDADRWVASGMWEGYVTSGETALAASLLTHVPINSDAGRAWAVLHDLAHAVSPYASNGQYLLPRPLEPAELAFADVPPREQWLFIPADQREQVGSWNGFIGNALKGRSRPPLVQAVAGLGTGFQAPWPWPPRKDGSLYTGPPDQQQTLATEQDAADFVRG